MYQGVVDRIAKQRELDEAWATLEMGQS